MIGVGIGVTNKENSAGVIPPSGDFLTDQNGNFLTDQSGNFLTP